MSSQRVTVFGGSGFLGRRIVRRLLHEQCDVVVASRHPRTELFRRDTTGAVTMRADVRDVTAVRAAAQGADGVVNAVGLYVENRSDKFQDVHVEGARNVAREADRTGARLVHISGIGVDEQSKSAYVSARARGEQQAVREAAHNCVILRPSVLFGPNDALLQTLEGITRLPVVPLFGRGAVRLQPVFVDDVAEAVARALKTAAPPATRYELGGPQVISYRDLLDLVCAHLRRRRLLLPVPFVAWELLTALLSLTPKPALTHDQLTLMRADNTVADDALTFHDLGIEPRSFGDEIVQCLPGAVHGRP